MGTTSPVSKLDVGETATIKRITSGNNMDLNFYNGSGAGVAGNVSRIRCDGDSVSNDYGALSFWTGRINTTPITERLRIDSSGNVGIGAGAKIGFGGTNTFTSHYIKYDSTLNGLQIDSYGTTAFATNNAERLRITSGGEVYIAGTTDQGAYNLQVSGTGVWGAGAYVNGSDSRIKEDIQPLTSGLDVVKKLNPVTYKYKETWSSDQSIQSGFIAQELLTALDGQIYVDGVVQQGGTEGYYSVAYQNLIPVLAKAIQELKSENDTLKSRIEALEAA